MKDRKVSIERNTNETKIKLTLNIDGAGISNINTNIPFFDHMLDGFARHGFFDLDVKCDGDIEVDCHHTVEDVGIVLGNAINKAIGDKHGIVRYGSCILPMDEALIICAVDLSGRPYFENNVTYSTEKLGAMNTQMINEFFYAVSYSAQMNLHLKQLSGKNDHHIAEASFKSFAKAMDKATAFDERITGVLSTKGSL